jgi:hypothetical protein
MRLSKFLLLKTYRYLNCGEEKEEIPGIEGQE